MCSPILDDGVLCYISKAYIYKSVRCKMLQDPGTLSVTYYGSVSSHTLKVYSDFEAVFYKRCYSFHTILTLSVAIFTRTIGNYDQERKKEILYNK